MSIKENQVLHYLIQGLTNQQIAEKYKVSVRTVEYRRQKLMKKYLARTPFQLGYRIGFNK